MLHCSSLVLRDVVRCDMNLVFFLFSLVSDFFGKKESVDANVRGEAVGFDFDARVLSHTSMQEVGTFVL
jgi:hypothetical protein